MEALALRDARASYGETAVLGPLTLTIRRGERVALVGRSGAGKSTLLSLLYNPARRDLALVPQDLGLVQTLSVFHNVYMGRLAEHGTAYNLANLIRPFRREVDAIRPLLARLGMADQLWSRAGELSGGQRQRVAVARALFQNAGVLLADEPVSALDGPLAVTVMEALTETYDTAVLGLHDIDLALRFAHRVVGIRDGGIALDEPAARLGKADLNDLY
ncbi:phosphonate ABC transporter ATP-binding protein [Spiribacter halobius]|uniref:ABC transporter n=1 Tax=Sediminicurvatus halobius TaxID=2182432 RepID=A0A2U2N6M1_9GAMM|nr:ATP-binding cassette domain-containing protein [Spiribacter halobius]PWG64835.1 ABC transporter [Spiribacter halobius]UEX78310.1 ATP-binding cassette domain-containing protein [Spiribacter halobius]